MIHKPITAHPDTTHFTLDDMGLRMGNPLHSKKSRGGDDPHHNPRRPAAGVEVEGLCLHALRATAATNALEHKADIAFVQKWLGHANIATTRLYDRRASRPKDSLTL
jgi:integrase